MRETSCETVEEYTLRINAVGYLGNCYIAEGGTTEQLQALDTDKWFTTKPNEGFLLERKGSALHERCLSGEAARRTGGVLAAGRGPERGQA